MCPLTGRALTSARLKCQRAVFRSVWQEACSGCPLMTLKHLLLSRKWICLSVALSSFFFSNWINWSNRRLSYPSCHAFYLWLIALFSPASLFLSTSRQYLCLVSFLPFLPLPLSAFHTSDLQFLCLPSICFLLLFFLLCLAIVCS